MGMGGSVNELALFAGAGGGILGGHLLGWRTVCAVEIEDYPRRVLLQRQADGILPRFPIWDDVCTFDGRPWRGKVDIVSGGFPCQDISSAGKGEGITGERSGLWKEMARIIGEVRPKYAFVENSPMLTSRGLGVVLGDLAEMGFNAEWGVIGAHNAGAPHKRDRIWILAYTNQAQFQGESIPGGIHKEHANIVRPGAWWETDPADAPESGLGRVADGVANWMDRLAGIGNGQVPAVVKLAWNTIGGKIE
jgi:DNA (cytosine-5)-methyltransferase 1